jgi:hypothetical protein
MRAVLAIAAIAFIGAAVQPAARTVEVQNTANVWDGKWQGTTVAGHPLVLQLKVQGQRMTGKLTVGRQSADIIEGKVTGDAFALTTGPIDGHRVGGTGRHLGDAIELTIEGVKEPLTLTRMK